MNKNPYNSKSKIRTIDPLYPDISVIHEAEQTVRQGGVIIFPTRNLYGLGADAFNLSAVEKVFHIKGRSFQKPVSILIRSRLDLAQFVTEIPPPAVELMDAFWPGNITLVFNARPELPEILTAGTGKIGIRVPKHPVAVALVNSLKHPITATSANLSGMEGAGQINDLPEAITHHAALILDAGPLKKGKGSTVVDVTTDPPTVLREGEISSELITR